MRLGAEEPLLMRPGAGEQLLNETENPQGNNTFTDMRSGVIKQTRYTLTL